ncbi:MAG: hypothetical protein IJT59_02340 [Desulfovibrionaceae bacterium]|nr:hypothetical protein [Desulfovibrionaceae bacterium]
MAVHILPVASGLDFNRFLDFPYQLYRHDSSWVPPIKSDDRALLSSSDHPFWQTAERKLFLALRSGQVVGRIAAIIDHAYNQYVGERCGAFGFFECLDDSLAAKMLLNAAYDWLKAHDLDYMRGPVNPSTNYTCGLLVAGFEEPPALLMPYNPPYYARLLEENHFYKEQDLFAYRIFKDKLNISPLIQAQIEQAKNNPRFHCRPANKDNLDRDIKIMLDLYRNSWAKNWYFSPLSASEENYLVDELIQIVDPNFFVLFFHEDTPAAGMVALPDLTPFLKALQGNLNFKAPLAYFKTKPLFERGYRIMLFGIREEFRLLGLPALLFSYMLGRANAKPNLEWVEGSWVLESNTAICDLIEDFSGQITKRYRIYRQEIEP